MRSMGVREGEGGVQCVTVGGSELGSGMGVKRAGDAERLSTRVLVVPAHECMYIYTRRGGEGGVGDTYTVLPHPLGES